MNNFEAGMLSAIAFTAGCATGAYCWRLRIIRKAKVAARAARMHWSIGIYTGPSPFALSSPENIRNPVLTARDVTDADASYVADPFLVKEGSVWYMFFEVLKADTARGEIALAISEDGYRFSYKQIVLREPFHLSYPYVFKWEDQYYMIPESHQASSVRLYRAAAFPIKWSYVCDLLQRKLLDSSIFRWGEKWWLFASDFRDGLHLFYAADLRGPWTEHSKSPLIVGNRQITRCAGRVLCAGGRVIRFTQDCKGIYGNQVRAFEVTHLSMAEYREKQLQKASIVKGTAIGWNAFGMHHVDAHESEAGQWIAAVDGFGDPDIPERGRR